MSLVPHNDDIFVAESVMDVEIEEEEEEDEEEKVRILLLFLTFFEF